ncbi:MAG: hypothetical protein IK078_11730 [Lachnospiraceae bacterium]|nr:hypothetical protein [Lachnospiraceae bacterium]
MELKDMTDLIRVYDAYKRIDHMMDLMVGRILPDEGSVMTELNAVTEVIARNSVLFQRDSKDPMFDVENSEHSEVLNDKRLTAEQRAFRILGICNEA